MDKLLNFSIIIDGDNVSGAYAETLLNFIKEKGRVIIARVYGDFSKLKSWKEPCQTFCIEPIHHFESNKNSTDMKIVTDVCFQIEPNHNINSYVIVSGDGDFTHLIQELKKKEKYIIGMSGSKYSTSKQLVNICDEFKYLDEHVDCKSHLIHQECPISSTSSGTSPGTSSSGVSIHGKKNSGSRQYVDFLLHLISQQDDKTYLLSRAKEALLRRWPDFSEKSVGANSFVDFISKFSIFKTFKVETTIYIYIE